jgi:predicted ATPase/DNA-binding CsgD family transcriptional regulator
VRAPATTRDTPPNPHRDRWSRQNSPGLQVAYELLDTFSDGVFFVSLAPITDPDLFVPAIAESLGIREIGGRILMDLLKAYLHDKCLLLLLDNFEQVLAASVQVTGLLTTCPQLKVLVTSRAVLHVRGEQEYDVPPLAVPDPRHLPDHVSLSQYEAVALFLQRAQAVKPDFRLNDANAAAIAEICVRLDGLPLAIELAAARLKVFTPSALLTRLEHRLSVLTGGAREVPLRQQTLRNTITWSYDLLDAGEQRLFRRLSVFVGGATLEAIEALYTALGDEPGQPLDGISSLVDKSLLRQSEPETEEPRFLMLETIREYGLEVLTASGEMEVTRQAHANYYLTLAEEMEPKLQGIEQFYRLEREHDNLRVALSWLIERGETEMALRLGGALWWFWGMRNHVSEGSQWLERAFSRGGEVRDSVRAKALNCLGLVLFWQGDYGRAKDLSEESLTLFRKVGDRAGIATSLSNLGLIEQWLSNYSAARSLAEEALALWREIGGKGYLGFSLNILAGVAIKQGEYTKARELAEEAARFLEETGDLGVLSNSQLFLVETMFFQGDYARAFVLAEENLRLNREIGDLPNTAEALAFLGQVALQHGDHTKAHALLEESVTLAQESQVPWNIARSLSILARVLTVKGDCTTARLLYEESLAIAHDKWEIAFSLQGLAAAVTTQSEPTWAARLWGAAEALREAIGTLIPPVYRTVYEQAVAAARTQLGERAFAAAWAEGRSMTLEQVLVARGLVTLPTLPKRAASYPDGLTAREVEVLRLVAQGLTDAHIAEQLIISPRTVNTHLTSIYSKIRVSSRSAATLYAIERHLFSLH